MIIGLGIDIVEIARMKSAMRRHGETFLHRIFTSGELTQASGRLSYLAGRWAAKEAAAKALGCGIGARCSFTDIEVLDDDLGAPRLHCNAPAAANAGKLLNWSISISHERNYAVAVVIIESGSGDATSP